MKFTYSTGDTPLDGYTIKRGLGRGGFGEVYFAVSDVGKEVALKKVDFMDADRGDNLILNINHSNLVLLYDIKHTADQDESWIIMEYMSGNSLRDVLTEHPEGLSIDEAAAWFFSIASGVHRLHENGYVHRDLKPGNVFFSEGCVKVGDYGLSKLISHSQQHNNTRAIGTCRYMAPEIGRGNYGRQIDIYALGIILYELLIGEIPFDGESDAEILTKHLTERPDLSRVPSDFRLAIERALEKDPEKRYQSVIEMMLDVPLPDYQAASGIRRPQFPDEFLNQSEQKQKHKPIPATDAQASPSSNLTPPQIPEGIPSEQPPMVNPPTVATIPTLDNVPVRSTTPVSTTPRTPPYFPPVATGTTKVTWTDVAMNDLKTKDRSQRFSELTSSLIRAVVGAAASTTLIFGVYLKNVELTNKNLTTVQTTQWFLWLMSVIMLSSWTVLIAGKFWESSADEEGTKRLVMFGAGAGLGALNLAIGNFLHLDFNDLHSENSYWPWVIEPWQFTTGGQPSYIHFAVFHGLLFSLCRWWLHATPARNSRYDVLAAMMFAMVAWFLPVAPQPLMPAVVAFTTLVVQFSSPSFSAAERKEFEGRANTWWQHES